MTKVTAPAVEKKFYVLINYNDDDLKKGWKKGSVILLPQVEAEPYISARIIMPFSTAISTDFLKNHPKTQKNEI